MEKNEEKGIFARIYNWFVSLTVKGLLGAILIAFIIIIILMSASYLPGIMSRISNSLSAALYSVFVPANNATVIADKKIINSGEDFNIIFKKGDDNSDGIFTISYTCDTPVDLFSIENSGLKKVDCDTKYYLLENDTNIKIRVISQDSVVRLVITGSFEDNTTQKTDTVGVVRVTVKNDALGTVVTPPVNNTPATTTVVTPVVPSTPIYVPSTIVTPAYVGKADLATRILQVGLLNQGTNIITNQTQFNYSDMVGIKFEVRNDGDANTGPWYFTASLPSLSTPTYNSNSQISLRPGESIIFTLGFGNLSNQSSSLITINVDPQNTVSESVEYNNIVTQAITNLGYNNNYYNNNNNYYNNNYTNGCYVNGIFTYNCLNNNYNYNYNGNYNYNNGYYDVYGVYHPYYNNNYYNYNGYYNNITASCYADPSNPDTGDRVRWYVNAYGGDGDYDFDWTGTNGLNSSSQNPTKTYSSTGIKYATVTVTDGNGDETSATCTVYVN